jgi:hypothetical protein
LGRTSKSIVITIPRLISCSRQSLETWATNICAEEDQRMESSAPVGSLKRNSRQKSHAWIMTSALCVATTSATIPLDHKVRDALLVNSSSLLWFKIISCSSHLTISFASFCKIAQAGGGGQGQGELWYHGVVLCGVVCSAIV